MTMVTIDICMYRMMNGVMTVPQGPYKIVV